MDRKAWHADSWGRKESDTTEWQLSWTDELLDWVSPQVRSQATFLYVNIWAFGHLCHLGILPIWFWCLSRTEDWLCWGNFCLGLGLVTLGEGLWFGVQVSSLPVCLVSLLFYVKWEVQVQFIEKKFYLWLKKKKDGFLTNIWQQYSLDWRKSIKMKLLKFQNVLFAYAGKES